MTCLELRKLRPRALPGREGLPGTPDVVGAQ